MPVGQDFDPWMLAGDAPQDVPVRGGVRATLPFFLPYFAHSLGVFINPGWLETLYVPCRMKKEPLITSFVVYADTFTSLI